MHEILFRGKRADNGQWVYGDLIHTRGGHPLICARHDFGSVVDGVEVDYNTVCQYTGMIDKNGNKIFEGDVVECVSWNEYFSDPTTGKVMEPFRRKMEVAFMAGGFKLVEHLPQPCKNNVWNMIVEGDLTVIGNIHDNPDLIQN